MGQEDADVRREAEDRVAFCLRNGRDHLNLAGLELTALPKDFTKLDGLRYLDLTDNRLTELPEEIGGFRDLLWLGINDNSLEKQLHKGRIFGQGVGLLSTRA